MTVRDWLEANKVMLEKYDLSEKAQMALLCGFDIEEISKTLPEWHMDTLTRTRYRQREAYFVDRELKCAANTKGQLDMSQQWLEVWQYNNRGRMFGDL